MKLPLEGSPSRARVHHATVYAPGASPCRETNPSVRRAWSMRHSAGLDDIALQIQQGDGEKAAVYRFAIAEAQLLCPGGGSGSSPQ